MSTGLRSGLPQANSSATLIADMPSTHRYSSREPSHLPRMISMSRTGEVSSNSMVPDFFSSANSRMVIMGIRNNAIVEAKPSIGRMMDSFRSEEHTSELQSL